MKVLLVSPLPPPTGGIATWTVRYKQYCEDNGISLVIINNALKGARGTQGTSKRNLIDETLRAMRIIGDFCYGIRKEKPDIIHLNTSCSRFGIYRDCICMMLAQAKAVPVVLQCHCNVEDQIRSGFATKVFRRMAMGAEKVLVLNRFSAAYAKKHAGENVEIVPNFADEKDLIFRNKVSETVNKVVYVGQVRKGKGVAEIVQAAKEFPDICFTLVGPVNSEIEELQHGDNVMLLGSQPHDRVMQLLSEADIFLFPSYTEGFANALLEAMATGLPVIATDVGANREMLEDKGGIIIPVANGISIVEALNSLQNDAVRRESMAKWNVEKVQRDYTLKTVMSRIVEIYETILSK